LFTHVSTKLTEFIIRKVGKGGAAGTTNCDRNERAKFPSLFGNINAKYE
jgi:hypothetical protein